MTKSFLLAAAALGVLTACSGDDDASSTTVKTAASTLQRDTAPSVPASDATALRDGNRAFAFDLYRSFRKADATGNVFFSPYSVSIALAMAYDGARGQTATEMAKTLHFTLPNAQLHPAFDAVDLAIAKTGSVSVGNSLWAQPTVAFEKPFLDTLATSYGTGVNLVDFGQPDQAAATIDKWVSDRTNAMIPKLLGADDVRAASFVLVNAIYFKDKWTIPFSKDATLNGTFHAAGGDVTTSMMHAGDGFRYAAGSGYQAVSLKYTSGLSMVAVLPDDLATFEASLDAAKWQSINDGLVGTMIDLTLPKLKLDTHADLASSLKGLGMNAAFSDGADFSGITAAGMQLQKVVHQAVVAVDEDGTEAAAATAVIAGATAVMIPPPRPSVVFDKPFLFAIQDDTTGALLFLGNVENPAK